MARSAALIGVAVAACGTRPPEPAHPPAARTTAAAPALACDDAPPLTGARLTPQLHHAGIVLDLAYSPDGHLLATAGADGSVRIWEPSTGALVRVLRDAAINYVRSIAWACDGTLVAGGGGSPSSLAGFASQGDQPVAVTFDPATGARGTAHTLGDHGTALVTGGDGRACWAALSPDGYQRFDRAGGSLGKTAVAAWDAIELARARDGQLAALVSGTAEVSVFRPSADAAKAWQAPLPIAEHVEHVAISPDGARLAIATFQRVTIYDAETGANPVAFADNLGSHAVALDQAHAFVGTGPDVHGFALATGKPTWAWRLPGGHAESLLTGLDDHVVRRVALSPDGVTLAVGAEDGRVFILRAADGVQLAELGSAVTPAIRAAFSPDGAHIYVASRDHVAVWSTATGELERTVAAAGLRDLAVSADGVTLAREPAHSTCAQNQEAREILRVPGELPERIDAPAATGGPTRKALSIVEIGAAGTAPVAPAAQALCLGRAGTLVIPREDDRALARGAVYDVVAGHATTAIRDLASGKRVELEPVDQLWVGVQLAASAPRAAGLTPDLFTIGAQYAVVWDATTGVRLGWFGIHEQGGPTTAVGGAGDPATEVPSGTQAWRVALSPDGAHVAVAAGARVAIFDIAAPTRGRVIAIPAPVTALDYIRGDALLVATSDGALSVVEGDKLRTAPATGRAWTSLRGDRDGRRALAIDGDGLVAVWDLAALRPIVSLIELADGESLAIAPQGYYTGSYDAIDRMGWTFDAPLELVPAVQFDRAARQPAWIAARLTGRTACRPQAARVQRPPRITIAAPPPPTTADAHTAIAVEASDTTAEVVAFVEGTPLARATGHGKLALDVPLRTGANRIEVLAFDAAGLASTPARASVSRTGTAPRGDLWIIAVGVSDYPHLPEAMQLRHADDDAKTLGGFARRYGGAGRAYGAVHVVQLTDPQVTGPAVDAALDELGRAMTEADIAIVLFSGHGVRLASGQMVFATPAMHADAASFARDGIGWDRVASRLAAARGKVVVLLDACHAGAMVGSLLAPNAELAGQLMSAGRAGTVVFSASRAGQESLEGAWNGEFTAALIAAASDPATDRDGDGWLQLSELVDASVRRVELATQGRQTPSIIYREVFGDFAVIPATKP